MRVEQYVGHECDSFYCRRPVEGLLPSFMDPIFESPILFKAGLCRRLRATGVTLDVASLRTSSTCRGVMGGGGTPTKADTTFLRSGMQAR